MQHKVIERPQLKTGNSGSGTLTGYASTWEKDSVGDIVVPGAYRETIPSWLRDGFIALGHSWDSLPIATPTSAVEDSTGLLITADFHSTAEAQAARTVIQERLSRGKSVKMSIGYEVLEDQVTSGARLLKKLRLHEVSLVNVPANQGAAVLSAKRAGGKADPAVVQRLFLDFQRTLARQNGVNLKEGRVLSGASRAKVAAARDALQELLDASEPKSWQQLFVEFQVTLARINGVKL